MSLKFMLKNRGQSILKLEEQYTQFLMSYSNIYLYWYVELDSQKIMISNHALHLKNHAFI